MKFNNNNKKPNVQNDDVSYNPQRDASKNASHNERRDSKIASNGADRKYERGAQQGNGNKQGGFGGNASKDASRRNEPSSVDRDSAKKNNNLR